MKIYEYTYNPYLNRVLVTQIEVEEKPKIFVVKRGCSSCFRNIKKNDIGVIHEGYYSKPMYLFEKDFDHYKQALVALKKRGVLRAEDTLARAKEEFDKVNALKEGE